MAKNKYYVVWKGRRPGIYNNWNTCSMQVAGYPGAEYKAFENLSSAESAFRGRYADFKGSSVNTGNWRTAEIKPVFPSICVDAACAGVPGPLEWRGVETESGKLLFKAGPFPDGTNNIGEFIAIVQGLEWMKKNEQNGALYSDSDVAIGWVKAKKCRTQMTRTPSNAPLFYLISRYEKWLAENPKHHDVLKWETEMWGENPADFGRK